MCESVNKESMSLPQETLGYLTSMSELKDGWIDGDGVAVDRRYVECAKRILVDLHAAGLTLPIVFADYEGGVSFEWEHLFGSVDDAGVHIWKGPTHGRFSVDDLAAIQGFVRENL